MKLTRVLWQFLSLMILGSMPLLTQANEKLSFSASIGVELGYDSNVVIEELDLSTSLGDEFVRFKLTGDAEYQLDKNQEVSAGLSIDNTQQKDASQFDLRTILGVLGYKYKLKKTTYSLTYRQADAQLSGSDFLELKLLSPSISGFLTSQQFLRGAYSYIDKALANNPQRNAEAHQIAIDYYYFLNGLNQYFIVSGRLRDEQSRSDLLDYQGTRFRFSFVQRYSMFSLEHKASLDYRLRRRTYDSAVDPAIMAFRTDNRSTIEIENETDLANKLTAILSIKYTDNDSNKNDFNFTETLVTVGFNYVF